MSWDLANAAYTEHQFRQQRIARKLTHRRAASETADQSKQTTTTPKRHYFFGKIWKLGNLLTIKRTRQASPKHI